MPLIKLILRPDGDKKGFCHNKFCGKRLVGPFKVIHRTNQPQYWVCIDCFKAISKKTNHTFTRFIPDGSQGSDDLQPSKGNRRNAKKAAGRKKKPIGNCKETTPTGKLYTPISTEGPGVNPTTKNEDCGIEFTT